MDQFTLFLSSNSAAQSIHGLNVNGKLPKGEVLFWTENSDEVYKSLLEKGVTGNKEPQNFRDDLRPSWILDPDDNLIEIVSRRPKSKND